MDITLHYLAVLVAAIASMVVGFLWYGPLFGKKWMGMMGMTEADINAAKQNKGGMGKSYVIAFIGSLVTAYVLAHIITMARMAGVSSGVSGGITSAFWVWLGFFATTALGGVLWERKSWSLYFLNTIHQLVMLLAMGAILAAWQ